MESQDGVGRPALIDYVKALECQDSAGRGRLVRSVLASLGVEFKVQTCRLPRITNIVVDFTPPHADASPREAAPAGKRVLLCAHYDVIRGRPGANDNASGVAVMLGVCRKLKHAPAPVRVVFFDREEAWLRTPVLRLGLLGSLRYAVAGDLGGIGAVFNVEFCGAGDSLAIWPVKRSEQDLDACRAARAAASSLGMASETAHVPWILLSSDHLPFRLRGLRNAVTLSLLPAAQVPDFKELIQGLSVWRLLTGRRPRLPVALSAIHTPADTSSRLSEDSLRMMESVLAVIVQAGMNEAA